MEVVVVVIRQKPNWGTQDYHPRLYDILLLDSKTPPGEKVKQAKYLPMFSMTISDEDPRESVLGHVYKITGGGDHGAGIKGERALQIPCSNRPDMNPRESLSRFSLFVVPVNAHDKLSRRFVDQAQNTPGFYQLDYICEVLNNGSVNFPSPTRSLLSHLESWLLEKHSHSGVIECLFRSRTDYRIRLSIHNPVFIPSQLAQQEDITSDVPTDIQKTANEALAKMLSIEKCDNVKMNPLFGSGLSYTSKVNLCVINKVWDQSILQTERRSSVPIEPKWDEKYPLHSLAVKGDVNGIRQLVKGGRAHDKKDSISWAPIHYGAWYGKESVVSVLLELGCSPNLTDRDENTPLHMAAKNGYPQVAKSLLLHSSIDVHARDSNGRTALDLCLQAPDRGRWHEEIIKYIHETQSVVIHLMDKTVKQFHLPSGYNTTVQQLCSLMLEEFGLPEETYKDIFTIWTCSPSLQLQLRPDHCPLLQLHQWNKTLHMLSSTTEKEEAILKWKRNAKISIEREKQLTHPAAIKMLFDEAYIDYIQAFYPCKDSDTYIFAVILLCLYYGEQETSVVKSFLTNDKNLKQLVPSVFLKAKGTQIISKIAKEYNNRDQSIGRDRSQLALQRKFLSHCHNLSVYGSAFFEGKLVPQKPSKSVDANISCHIGVNDVGLHIINAQTKVMIHSYNYSEMSKWLCQKFVLEIHVLRSDRSKRQHITEVKIRTKQAGLIVKLMDKLVQMHFLNVRR